MHRTNVDTYLLVSRAHLHSRWFAFAVVTPIFNVAKSPVLQKRDILLFITGRHVRGTLFDKLLQIFAAVAYI